MWVSNTWVMRTPCCEGEGEDTVEVALRVDHQRDPAIMDKVAAVTKARGVDRDDLQHLSQPLPYPQGYTSYDARSATGPQPPVGYEVEMGPATAPTIDRCATPTRVPCQAGRPAPDERPAREHAGGRSASHAGRGPVAARRSEERRVGKECRSRWS